MFVRVEMPVQVRRRVVLLPTQIEIASSMTSDCRSYAAC